MEASKTKLVNVSSHVIKVSDIPNVSTFEVYHKGTEKGKFSQIMNFIQNPNHLFLINIVFDFSETINNFAGGVKLNKIIFLEKRLPGKIIEVTIMPLYEFKQDYTDTKVDLEQVYKFTPPHGDFKIVFKLGDHEKKIDIKQ
jgi:hypothetical protein